VAVFIENSSCVEPGQIEAFLQKHYGHPESLNGFDWPHERARLSERPSSVASGAKDHRWLSG
jgi:hypothetical protein